MYRDGCEIRVPMLCFVSSSWAAARSVGQKTGGGVAQAFPPSPTAFAKATAVMKLRRARRSSRGSTRSSGAGTPEVRDRGSPSLPASRRPGHALDTSPASAIIGSVSGVSEAVSRRRHIGAAPVRGSPAVPAIGRPGHALDASPALAIIRIASEAVPELQDQGEPATPPQ